jgi:hypothetical protein
MYIRLRVGVSLRIFEYVKWIISHFYMSCQGNYTPSSSKTEPVASHSLNVTSE